MLALLFWLAGVLGIGYEITKHRLWEPGLAGVAVLAFGIWLVAGAKIVSDGLRSGFSGRGIRNQSRGAGSGPLAGRKTLNDPTSAAPPPQNAGR